MEKEKIDQEFQKKILEFNLLDARIRELEQNLALLEKQIAELQTCQISLDEIKNSKKDSEILAPVSSGIFIKGKLENNSEVLIDIGSKTLCRKNVDEAKKIIQSKLDKALEVHEKLINEVNKVAQNLANLEKQIINSKQN